MRLIQQKPSWALHAFLRFNDLKYASEYAPSFSALGRSLPILVTGKAVVSEEESMTHLSEQLFNDATDHKLSLDGILAKFIKSAIVGCFNQIVRCNGDHRDIVFKSSPAGLGVVFAGVLDIQDALNKDKFDFLPGASEEELLNNLKLQYKQLDAALQGHENEGLSSLISISKNSFLEAQRTSSIADGKRGQADAVLFGHIAEVLCNENLAPIVQKYPALIKFFENICSTYFAVPFTAQNSEASNWNVALSDLLSNPYLHYPQCDRVKTLLTTPKKGGLELTFKSTSVEEPAAGGVKSVLYLNNYNAIDEREIEVHDHTSQSTTVVLNKEGLSSTVQAVVDKSSQVLDNIKTSVGLNKEGTSSSAGRGSVDRGLQTHSSVVGVSVGGIVYLGLIAACFVGYAVAAK